MDVSIIIPLYKPDRNFLKKIREAIKNQDYEGKIKVIEVEGKGGLSAQMNYGMKNAKTEIVVSLHQDCVPSSKNWLRKLVEPFEEKNVAASVSRVELPKKFWEGFSLPARIMSAKEEGVLIPLMDEKGCAYRKKVLEKVGFFDGKKFRTAGEDFDMWIKLRKVGKIAYPDCRILHYHEHTFKNRIKKEFQLSNGFGALVRIYGKEMPKWYSGILKSIPILGWPIFLVNFPYKKLGIKSLLWIPISLGINFIYCFGFWRGFFEGKQTI